MKMSNPWYERRSCQNPKYRIWKRQNRQYKNGTFKLSNRLSNNVYVNNRYLMELIVECSCYIKAAQLDLLHFMHYIHQKGMYSYNFHRTYKKHSIVCQHLSDQYMICKAISSNLVRIRIRVPVSPWRSNHTVRSVVASVSSCFSEGRGYREILEADAW